MRHRSFSGTGFPGLLLFSLLAVTASAAEPEISTGPDWIQNATTRIELVGGQLRYLRRERAGDAWELFLEGMAGGSSQGATLAVTFSQPSQNAETRIENGDPCMNWTQVGVLPDGSSARVQIRASLRQGTPFLRVECRDAKGQFVGLGFMFRFSEPGRYVLQDQAGKERGFTASQKDATAHDLQPFFLGKSASRFLAVYDPRHPRLYALFDAPGSGRSFSAMVVSGGRRFTQFSHINDPVTVWAGFLPASADPDLAFHWTTGLYLQLKP